MRPGYRVPQANCIVPTPTCKRPAIRTEGDALDRRRMPFKGAYVVARVHVPQTDSLVPTPTCKRPAIWTERYAIDPTCMPSEGADMRPRLPRPTGELYRPNSHWQASCHLD